MKTFTPQFKIFISCLLILLTSYGLRAQTVINEIRPESFTSPTGGLQQASVELFNPGPGSQNLNGFNICDFDRNSLFSLPAISIPQDAVLTIYFGTGTDDLDFSDGHGTLFTNGDSTNIFSTESDAVALYNSSLSQSGLQDYAAWGSSFPTGQAGNDAISSGQWSPGDLISFPSSLGATLGRIPDGRDRDVSEDFQPILWEDHIYLGEGVFNPVQISPFPGEILTSTSVTFTWRAIDGAIDYTLVIDDDSTFGSPLVQLSVGGDTSDVQILPNNDFFHWKVEVDLGSGPEDNNSTRSFGVVTGVGIGPPSPTLNTLTVPYRQQRKDASLLCITNERSDKKHPAVNRYGCTSAAGDMGPWDSSHPLNHAGDNRGIKCYHCGMYCVRACIQMTNLHEGGDLSQDRISYEIGKNLPNSLGKPEQDLGHGRGVYTDEASPALSWALSGATVRTQVAEINFDTIKAEIDAGRPIMMFKKVGTKSAHATLIVGYQTIPQKMIMVHDPWPTKGTTWVRFNDEKKISYTYFTYVGSPTGRMQEASVTTDSDGDGVMDFDEDNRFCSSSGLADTDIDENGDKQEIHAYTFHEDHHPNGHSDAEINDVDWPDIDGDGMRMPCDCDCDNDKDFDGGEDINGDGNAPQAAINETCPFDTSQKAMAVDVPRDQYWPWENVWVNGGTGHSNSTYPYAILLGCPALVDGQALPASGSLSTDTMGKFSQNLGSFGPGLYKFVWDILKDNIYQDPNCFNPWDCFTVVDSMGGDDTDTCTTGDPVGDNDPLGLSKTITLTGLTNGTLGQDVCVEAVHVQIDHPNTSELNITLTSPNGVVVTLFNNHAGSGLGTGCGDYTEFRMGGVDGSIAGGGPLFQGSFTPVGNLYSFSDGTDVNGNWTLNVVDNAPGNIGQLFHFEIEFGPARNRWIGAVDNDWKNPANWSSNSIFVNGNFPSDCIDFCTIGDLGSVAAYPVIDANLVTGPINVGTLIFNGETGLVLDDSFGPLQFNVCQNIFFDGNVDIINPNIPLRLVGPNPMNVNVTPGSHVQIEIVEMSLTSPNPIQVNNLGDFDIHKSLELVQGDMLVPNNPIRLKSANGQTAFVDDFSPGHNGLLFGPITLEREIINPGTAFHFIAPGVQGANLSDWSNEFNLSGPNNAQVIPMPDCNFNNLASNSPYGALFDYRENAVGNCQLEAWHVRSAGPADAGRGFAGIIPNGTTIDLTGQMNTGVVLFGPLTKSPTNSSPAQGWNMPGNPYASSLSWPAVAGGNPQLGGVAYVWQSTGYYGGTLQPLSSLNPADIIPSSQSFQVEVTGPAPASTNILFDNAMRVRNDASFRREIPGYEKRIDLVVEGNGFADKTHIFYLADATAQWDDRYDGRKLASADGQPTFFSGLDAAPFSINARPDMSLGDEIPLGLIPGRKGDFSIRLDKMEFVEFGTGVWLEDKQEGVWQALHLEPEYQFYSKVTDDPDRFVLHLMPGPSVEAAKGDCQDQLGTIKVSFPAQVISQVGLIWQSVNCYDMQGNLISGKALSAPVTQFDQLAPGKYRLEFVAAQGTAVVDTVVRVEQPLIVEAVMALDKQQVEVGEVIQFMESSIGANSYEWDLGNGLIVDDVQNFDYAYEAAGLYTVRFTASNDDCTDWKENTVSVSEKATGIEDHVKNPLSAYASGNDLTIEFDGNGEAIDFGLYDLQGKLIQSGAVDGRTVWHLDVAPAVYLLRSINHEKAYELKVPIGL